MRRKSVFLMAAGFLAFAGPAAGQVTLTLGVDPLSHYVWRGADLLDGGVGAFQPWATLDLGETGLSVGIWGSFGIRDRGVGNPPRSEADELDFSLDFARDVGAISLAAGFIHYNFIRVEDYPRNGSTTHEFYAGAGLNSIPFAPTLTVYYDPNTAGGDGTYLELSGEQELPVGVPLTLSLSGGYMDQPGYRPESGISDLNVGLSLPLPVGSLEITPLVVFTHALSSGTSGSDFYLPSKSTVWGGLSISTTAIPLFR